MYERHELQASYALLLKHIFTYTFIKTHLIEEPLNKYSFVKKNDQLKAIYVQITAVIAQFLQTYLQRNQEDLLNELRHCYNVDWTSYQALQPVGDREGDDVVANRSRDAYHFVSLN